MEKERKYTTINNIFICIFTILFFYLGLKKCGFYKTDILVFSLGLEIIGAVYIIYNYIINNKKRKFDIIGLLILGLSASYALSIVFSNFTSLNDAICEYIRYFNLYLVYKIVTLSDDKKLYKNILAYMGIFFGIFGIDGMGTRVFQSLLEKLNSGYLNVDFDRMSSLVQYANTFAIILLVSSVCVFEKLLKAVKEKNTKNIIIYHTILVFYTSCIILSQSRVVALLLIISVIIYYLFAVKKNKKENISMTLLIIFLLIECLVYSSLVLKGINIDNTIIYYLTLLLIGVNIIGSYLILKILKKVESAKKKSLILKKHTKYITIVILSFSVIYISLGMLITSDLKISEKSTQTVKRYVYNVEKDNENNLNFTVQNLNEDSRYKIDIYGISNKNEKTFLKSFEYFDTVSGNFSYNIKDFKDLKCIELDFNCYKGSIKVVNSHINDKNMSLEYTLLPTEIVNKVKDMLTSTDSLSSRMIYLKDAFNIWNLSLKNRIIGIGGEGFKNSYQLVQNQSYTSTEVHNSFMQILVESGIIGVTCIIAAVIIWLQKSPKNIYKYAMILLIIHSLIDLDFSYMFVICIFGILLGINTQDEKESKIKENGILNFLKYIQYTFVIFLSIFNIIIVLKMNVAYYMKVPKYEEKDLNIENIEYLIKLNEKRVSYDFTDNRYREELADSYQKYLENLKFNSEDILKEKEQQNDKLILEKSEKNAKEMEKNNAKDKETLINISDIYFFNLKYILNLGEFASKDKKCEEYIQKIIANLKFIKENYRCNEIARNMVYESSKKYLDEILKIDNGTYYIAQFVNYLKSI